MDGGLGDLVAYEKNLHKENKGGIENYKTISDIVLDLAKMVNGDEW